MVLTGVSSMVVGQNSYRPCVVSMAIILEEVLYIGGRRKCQSVATS
jgi:hypothetical protein